MKELKPHMDEIIKKIEHPEFLEALKPKIVKGFQDLKPEFDKAAKDTRSFGKVMKEMRPKFDEAFKELEPELEKVWKEVKSGLGLAYEILDDSLIAALIAGAATAARSSLPLLLIAWLVTDPITWDAWSE
jgi:hypothetical protein